MNIYEQYVSLREEMRLLEEKEKNLKQEILVDLKKSNVEKAITDLGTFTICKKVSWEYTDSVKKIEDRLKIAKVREQEQGKATQSLLEYVMFSNKK